MSIKKMIERLTNYFADGLENPSEEDIEILKYSLEVYLYNLPKTIFIFLLAIYFNKLMEFIVIFFSYGLIRNFSHGMHLQSPWSCFIYGLINFTVMTVISMIFVLPKWSKILIFAYCFVVYSLFSPSGTENRPIGKKEYSRKKKISLIILLFYFALSFISTGFMGNVLAIVSLSQSFSILPIIYTITNQKGGIIYEEKSS